MSKLYFYYSAMNAGKTTSLLQSSYNYQERGMNTLILKPEIDTRFGIHMLRSRIGLEATAKVFTGKDNLFVYVKALLPKEPLHCILVDEAQFLKKAQVFELSEIVDQLDIPVLTYGLRTDFQGELFEGSRYLLAWADEMREIKTICACGKKAIMVIRIDESGQPIHTGSQIQIGDNHRYLSLCRKHYKQKFYDSTTMSEH